MLNRWTTTGRRRRGHLVAVTALLVAVVATVAPAGAASAAPTDMCDMRANVTYEMLLECVTVEGVLEHDAAFQQIADSNGGTRASGTPGYDASADYVAALMEGAGYQVTRQEFQFPYFEELSPAVLEQTAPAQVAYDTGTFEFSGSGDVTGPVVPVDLNIGGPSTSGCEVDDFAGVDLSGDNDIALIRRGACTFALKAQNAQTAGAEAVVIFNTEPGTGVIVGTLGEASAGVVTIPVVGASYEDGLALRDATEAHVATETFFEVRTTENVIADSTRGDSGNVVMAGSHLDSVSAGPGINDNGSGSAALLETALMMAKVAPTNQMRFAWWGAEESGLVGSWHYVDTLPQDDLDDIALYMNYDMVASPNFVHTVYDADESSFAAEDFGVVVPEGSAAIEDVYESFYTWKGVPYDDTGFSGRSDYQGFIFNDIPSSGLFTGAEEIKTPEQQAIWGGTAGDAFDPCYHQACDSLANLSHEALDVNSDAIAFAMLTFAYSTEAVNGVPGTSVPGGFEMPEPAGPEGTFVGSGGSGPAPGVE